MQQNSEKFLIFFSNPCMIGMLESQALAEEINKKIANEYKKR